MYTVCDHFLTVFKREELIVVCSELVFNHSKSNGREVFWAAIVAVLFGWGK